MHMDKPGSASDADFDRLMDLVEEKQLPFQTGYMYRYNPAVVQLMEDLRGTAGRNLFCRGSDELPSYR